MHTKKELGQRLSDMIAARDGALRELGQALLEGASATEQRGALAAADRDVRDVEAMLAAVASRAADEAQSAELSRFGAVKIRKIPLATYQKASRLFLRDYDRLKGTPALMDRATSLYELAKASGNSALSDVRERFKNFAGSPELLEFTDARYTARMQQSRTGRFSL